MIIQVVERSPIHEGFAEFYLWTYLAFHNFVTVYTEGKVRKRCQMFPCLHVLTLRPLVDNLLPAANLNASQTFMKLGVQYGYTRFLGYIVRKW